MTCQLHPHIFYRPAPYFVINRLRHSPHPGTLPVALSFPLFFFLSLSLSLYLSLSFSLPYPPLQPFLLLNSLPHQTIVHSIMELQQNIDNYLTTDSATMPVVLPHEKEKRHNIPSPLPKTADQFSTCSYSRTDHTTHLSWQPRPSPGTCTG